MNDVIVNLQELARPQALKGSQTIFCLTTFLCLDVFPEQSSAIRLSRIHLQCRRPGFDLWLRKTPWRREWQSIPVFLSGEFHRQKSLAGYSPWGHRESDMNEKLTFSCFLQIASQSLPFLLLYLNFSACTKAKTYRGRRELINIQIIEITNVCSYSGNPSISK